MSVASCYLPYERYESCARELVSLSNRIGDGWELKTVKVCSEPARIFLTKTTNHSCLESTCSTDTSNDVLLDLAGFSEVEDIISDPAVVEQALPQRTVCVEYHIVYSESYEVPILYFNATQLNGAQLALDDIWSIVSKTLTSSGTDRWSLVSQQEHPLLCRPFYHVHPCHTAKVMGKAFTVTRRSSTVSPPPDDVTRAGSTADDVTRAGSTADDVTLAGSTADDVTRAGSTADDVTRAGSTADDVTRAGSTADDVISTGSTADVNYLISWLSVFGPLVGLRVPLAYSQREE